MSAWQISSLSEVGNLSLLPLEQRGYKPLGNEVDQLRRELRALSNRFSAFNQDGAGVKVDLATLTKLADDLDKINAKVKMAIRNLKIKQLST